MKVDKGFMIFQYLSCFCLAAIVSRILSLDPVFAVSMFISLSASSILSTISDCFLETDSSSTNLSSVNISSGRSFSSPASKIRIIIILLVYCEYFLFRTWINGIYSSKFCDGEIIIDHKYSGTCNSHFFQNYKTENQAKLVLTPLLHTSIPLKASPLIITILPPHHPLPSIFLHWNRLVSFHLDSSWYFKIKSFKFQPYPIKEKKIAELCQGFHIWN